MRNLIANLREDPWGNANKPPHQFSKRETAGAIVAVLLAIAAAGLIGSLIVTGIGALASVTLGER